MNCLIIFAKAPIPGKVKTRLKVGTSLSDDDLCLLYRSFLMDTIDLAMKTKVDNIFLAFTPPSEKESIIGIVRDSTTEEKNYPQLKVFPQIGDTFDKRFFHAIQYVTEKVGGNIALIGSDIPHMQPRMIDKAFDFLAKNTGMVLGPSTEGGVYLVGVRSGTLINYEGVFTKGIEIENLVKIAKEKRMPLKLLEEMTDIDIVSDLVTLICKLNAMSYSSKFGDVYLPKNTIEVVEKLGLQIMGDNGSTRGRRIVKI